MEIKIRTKKSESITDRNGILIIGDVSPITSLWDLYADNLIQVTSTYLKLQKGRRTFTCHPKPAETLKEVEKRIRNRLKRVHQWASLVARVTEKSFEVKFEGLTEIKTVER